MNRPDPEPPRALRTVLKLLAVVAILGGYLLLFSALLAGTKVTTGLTAFGLLLSGVVFAAGALALAVFTASSIQRAALQKEMVRRFVRTLGIVSAIVLLASVLEYTFLIVATDWPLSTAIRHGGTGRLIATCMSFITMTASLQLSLLHSRGSQRDKQGRDE